MKCLILLLGVLLTAGCGSTEIADSAESGAGGATVTTSASTSPTTHPTGGAGASGQMPPALPMQTQVQQCNGVIAGLHTVTNACYKTKGTIQLK
jgi:hypothetical protein